MNSSVFPALASEVSVSVAGTGSYLPDHRVSNQEILRYLRPARPDGRLLEPDWVVRHLGIHERRLDYEFGGRRKRSRPDGGLYDGDLALRAARSALDDAGITAVDVDLLVHVTSTPDMISCQDHFRFLTTGLGLRRDADLVHHNLGCAGLAAGFRTVAASLISMVPATALVVASNCPSGYFAPEAHDDYYKHPSGMGWLTPLMFADGAGAAVFTSARRRHGDWRRGLLSVRYETSPDVELVSYPAGGCLHRTSAANLSDHVFLMDAVKVAEVFPPLMTRNFDMLQEDWPASINPATGNNNDPRYSGVPPPASGRKAIRTSSPPRASASQRMSQARWSMVSGPPEAGLPCCAARASAASTMAPPAIHRQALGVSHSAPPQ